MITIREMMQTVALVEAEKAQKAEAARTEAARRLKLALEMRRGELVEWLGELAGEFMTDGGRYYNDGEWMVWELRPRGWGRGFDAVFRGDRRDGQWVIRPSVHFSKGEFGIDVENSTAGDNAMVARLLWEIREDGVKALRKTLDVNQGTRKPEKAAEAYEELMAMAPEGEVEWEVMLRAWRTAYRERAQREQALVEEYRPAMEAWAEEVAAVEAANRAVVAALQEKVNVPVVVRDIEYGVVAREDGETFVTTRLVQALTEEEDRSGHDGWIVFEAGRTTYWQFRHIVRVGEARRVYPVDDAWSGLFLQRMTRWGWVAYQEEYDQLVADELGRLREEPEEPSWYEMMGDGSIRPKEVEEIFLAAHEKVRAAREGEEG